MQKDRQKPVLLHPWGRFEGARCWRAPVRSDGKVTVHAPGPSVFLRLYLPPRPLDMKRWGIAVKIVVTISALALVGIVVSTLVTVGVGSRGGDKIVW